MRARGFTLLEVLVALAILAVAMGALIAMSSQHTANAAYLRDRTLAHWTAMNVLSEWQLQNPWPETGKYEGRAEMGNKEWFWKLEVSNTPESGIRRLEVKVSANARDEPLASVTGFAGR